MTAEKTEQTPEETPAATEQDENKGSEPYHVSDLPEGAEPDPLGDARLSPRERAGHGGSNG